MEAVVLGVISVLLGAGQFYYARKQYQLSKHAYEGPRTESTQDVTPPQPGASPPRSNVRRPPIRRYVIATVFVVFGAFLVMDPASVADSFQDVIQWLVRSD